MSIKSFRPIKVGIGSARGHAYNAADLRRQLDTLVKNFADIAVHMKEEAAEILEDALRPTFELSQKYVPKDTLRLMHSGYLVIKQTSKGAQAAMGYAEGGNPHYALYVHEIPRAHADPTSWKYLQRAIDEDGDNIKQRLYVGVRKAMGIGRGT